MDIHGYPGFSWVFMDGCPWISMNIHGYPLISMDAHGYLSFGCGGARQYQKTFAAPFTVLKIPVCRSLGSRPPPEATTSNPQPPRLMPPQLPTTKRIQDSFLKASPGQGIPRSPWREFLQATCGNLQDSKLEFCPTQELWQASHRWPAGSGGGTFKRVFFSGEWRSGIPRTAKRVVGVFLGLPAYPHLEGGHPWTSREICNQFIIRNSYFIIHN